MTFAFNITDPQDFWLNVVQHRITHAHGVSRTSPSVAQARKTIDNELAAMHRAMCTLRTRHNALTAVSFLPPETLIHIFQLYASALPSSTNNERPLGWIEVTHVCKAWRETALNCPGLWSEICFKLGRQWVDLMLNRTRGIPIAIHHYMDKDAYEYCSGLVLEHFHRVRHLRLSGSSKFMQPVSVSLLSPPRVLETLELISYLTLDSPPAMQLPSQIAESDLPSLRRFALRGFWIPWSAPILCNANMIRLEIHIDEPESGPVSNFLATLSRDHILSALKHMHSLEELMLWRCLPSIVPQGPNDDDVVFLSQLKKLSLRGPAAACFNLSGQLELRPACRRHFLCEDYTQSITEVLPILRGHIHLGPDLPPLHTIAMRRLRQGGYFIKLWRSYEALPESRSFFCELDADLCIWLPPSEPRLTAVQAFCEALPMNVVRSIHVDLELEDDSWTYHDWISVFGRCTAVTTARIRGGFSMAFCNALTATMHDVEENIESGTENHYFLPYLEDLAIMSVNFEGWGERFGAEDNMTHLWLLQKWLSNRRDVHELPQLSVHLDCCEIEARWVRALGKIVTVTWDGSEGRLKEFGSRESGEDSDDD